MGGSKGFQYPRPRWLISVMKPQEKLRVIFGWLPGILSRRENLCQLPVEPFRRLSVTAEPYRHRWCAFRGLQEITERCRASHLRISISDMFKGGSKT